MCAETFEQKFQGETGIPFSQNDSNTKQTLEENMFIFCQAICYSQLSKLITQNTLYILQT